MQINYSYSDHNDRKNTYLHCTFLCHRNLAHNPSIPVQTQLSYISVFKGRTVVLVMISQMQQRDMFVNKFKSKDIHSLH